MNELLAVILIVFDTERDDSVQGCEIEYLQHDVYIFFDAILTSLGVAKLYQETKDLSEVNAEQTKHSFDASLFGVDPLEASKRR